MQQSIHNHQFDNGLVLLGEPMDWLESCALALLVPCGAANDADERWGLANMVCEMAERGCGPRNSREFVEDLELLGVDWGSSVSVTHTSFGASMPAESLPLALPLFFDLVRRPLFPANQFEQAREVCLQDVRAIEDDVAQQVKLEARRRRYPHPLGRGSHGSAESLGRITMQDVRRHYERMFVPDGAILSVAGNFAWPRLRDQVQELIDGWSADALPEPQLSPAEGGHAHLPHDTNQTHIALTFPSAAYRDESYYQARGAVGVLSDGASSRLFTEIREKRGLVYSVYAVCHSLRDRGSVACYAGTSTDRAQETLDVLVAELLRLPEGVSEDELSRLKAQVKSGLIMQQESSRSRAAAMAGDWYHLGRVRTLDEVGEAINGLTCQSIQTYLREHPPRDFSIVTLGEKPLEIPQAAHAVS